MKNPVSVDEYITGFPEKTRERLEQFRETIRRSAPGAEETISYNMPAYKQNGPLVYFAGHANHIGFYPRPSGIEAFKNRLSDFKSSKGAVQFPLDQPVPFDLIGEIVTFRVYENLVKTKTKKNENKR
jgi:uncharacterized protein YdhG (YjbR/CyaY superfamily)